MCKKQLQLEIKIKLMTKKQKSSRTKNVKKRKYYKSIVITLLLMSCHFIFWITRTLYFYTKKNTFLSIGSFLFIIGFGVVSFNALFLQTAIHHNVFTKMKFTFFPAIKENSPLLSREEKLHAASPAAAMPSQSHLRKSSSSHSLSENTLKMQKELAKLGFYDGPLDGIEGPKMRRAIALWKQPTNPEIQKNTLPNSTTDEIAALIQQSEMEKTHETKKIKDPLLSKETVLTPPIVDITQVQKALRIFGHPEVVITGVEDQKTIEALKQFQKMFDLPRTGKVDHTVVMKMREVGLLN